MVKIFQYICLFTFWVFFTGINQNKLGYASEIQETRIILGFEKQVLEQPDGDFLPPNNPQIIPDEPSLNEQQSKLPRLHARKTILFFIGCLLSVFLLIFWFLRAIFVRERKGYS